MITVIIFQEIRQGANLGVQFGIFIGQSELKGILEHKREKEQEKNKKNTATT